MFSGARQLRKSFYVHSTSILGVLQIDIATNYRRQDMVV